jgi:WD40 repeat protein
MNKAFESDQPLIAAEAVREARRQPGFRRGAEAITGWGKLYGKLRRSTLVGGWEEKTLIGHEAGVNAVLVMPDGEHILSGGSDAVARLWNIASGETVMTLKGHTNRIIDLSVSVDGKRAVTVSGDGSMRVWNLEKGETTAIISEKSGIHAAAIAADGRFVLAGVGENGVTLYDAATGRVARSFRGHNSPVISVALSRDGRYAITGSDDKTARIWDLRTSACLRVLSGHIYKINAVDISFDGSKAVTASDDMTAILWDTDTVEKQMTFEGCASSIESVTFSFDMRYTLTCDANRTVRLWDNQTGEDLRVFEGHSLHVRDVALSADGRYGVSCGDDKTVKVWRLDWELEQNKPAAWDAVAESLIETFVARHAPPLAELPIGRDPFEKEVTSFLTRTQIPVIDEAALDELMIELGHAGFGWLTRKGVEKKVTELVDTWAGPRSVIVPPVEEKEAEDKFGLGERIEMEEDDEDDMKTTGFTDWMKSFATKRRS